MNDKWFSETQQGVEQFRKTYPELESVVRTRVPKDVYDRSFKHPNIDTPVPAEWLQDGQLIELLNGFRVLAVGKVSSNSGDVAAAL